MLLKLKYYMFIIGFKYDFYLFVLYIVKKIKFYNFCFKIKVNMLFLKKY